MHGALKIAAPLAALMLAAVTLTGCVLEPAPYYGGGYYAQPAPVYGYGYYGPSYYYGSRWGYHHRRGGWHGGGHHHWH